MLLLLKILLLLNHWYNSLKVVFYMILIHFDILSYFANVVEPHSKVFHYQSVTIHSLNITPYDDQITFARKWFAPAMNEILNVIPINYEMKKYGIMGFRYEIKDDSVGDEKRIVLAK